MNNDHEFHEIFSTTDFTDYTDFSDYILVAKATIIMDLRDSCVLSVASGKAERASPGNLRLAAIIKINPKNLCNL